MADRDRDLIGLFVRDLDAIPLPARGVWRGESGKGNIAMRASRMLVTVGAVVGVLALALLVGYQMSQRQQSVAGPSASPTASPTHTPDASPSTAGSIGSTASPSSTVAPTGGYDDDFGFVLAEPGRGATATIRRESGPRLGSLDQAHFAVSPDGKQIAWFTPDGAQQQLRVASVSDVTKPQLTSGLGAGERGGTIVWSNDSGGLLYQTFSVPPAPSTPPGNPSLYSIHRLDLLGARPSELVVLTTPTRGLVLEPIAWDRAGNVAAVVETGDGGFMMSYDVIRFNGNESNTTKTAVVTSGGQYLAFSVRASTDAKLVLGGAIGNGAAGLEWWPLADFGARRAIAGSQSGLWRPGTHEIATVGGCAGDPACGPNGGVRLLDVEKGTSRIVYGMTAPNMLLRTFRADGSALIMSALEISAGSTRDYTLIPLSGASPVTFKEVNGLTASVRFR